MIIFAKGAKFSEFFTKVCTKAAKCAIYKRIFVGSAS